MGVDDLGDLDGMLFQFPNEAISGFWMKGHADGPGHRVFWR